MLSRFAIPVALTLLATSACASEPAATRADAMTQPSRIEGEFEVKIAAQTADNPPAQAAGLMRMAIDKTYHGDLAATGQGEMLASGDGRDSGAYVALEKVSGTLQGKSGSFVLMHHAMLNHGVPENWKVTVVRDSGTGELTGLTGEMTIRIADGKHYYSLDFTLPSPSP